MSSNAERAETLARVLHAAIGGGSDEIRELCTDDVKVWTPARAASTVAELVDQAERRDAAFSDVDLDVAPLDVAGDYACAEWTATMTHSGPIELADGETIDATGVRVELHGTTVAEFHGTKICALREYWDELSALEQLGVIRRDLGGA